MTKSTHQPYYNAAMEIIYIDSLFLLNLIIDYLLCLVSARVCGIRLRRVRYIAAAAVGAAYAVALYLPGLGFLSAWAMKLLLWLVMAIIAYGGEECMMRCGCIFAAVSAAFGGFIYAIELAGGRPAFDMRTLVLSFALCYCAMRLIFGGRARLAEQRRVNVTLELEGRKTEFTALVDTGNQLTDPLSGCAVMAVSPKALEPLFPQDRAILELDGVELMEAAASSPQLRGKFRLIPYSTLSGSGMLCAFRADKTLSGGKELKIMTAISKNASGDGFQALI